MVTKFLFNSWLDGPFDWVPRQSLSKWFQIFVDSFQMETKKRTLITKDIAIAQHFHGYLSLTVSRSTVRCQYCIIGHLWLPVTLWRGRFLADG
jgi:hypothetical protein